VVVPLRTSKVTAKAAGGEMLFEGVSVAELAHRMVSEMVGRDGIEPPTPGFSVGTEGLDYEPPSSHIVDNQADNGQ
jgi:hypothetical protein